MICKVCKGTGKQTCITRKATITGAKELSDGGMEVNVSDSGQIEDEVEINCIWCDGTGQMTEQQARELEQYRNAWCRCKNRSGQHPYRHTNGAHGWKCNDCGKITQTG